MRLKGSFTVEGAYIFPCFVLIIAAIIMLDIQLHDGLLSDVSKILGAVRYYESEKFYYDIDEKRISLSQVVASPLIFENGDFAEQNKKKIEKSVDEYFLDKKLGWKSKISGTDIEDVLDLNDNANIVRSGGKIIQLIGG